MRIAGNQAPEEKRPSLLTIDVVAYSYMAGFRLQDIRVSLHGGELVALVGPNGSGKSTLLKLAAGILRGGQTDIAVAGHSVQKITPREGARWISWVPQRAETLFSMNVREMVKVGRYRMQRPLRTPPPGEDAEVEDAIESVGLGGLSTREVDTLSGGEWQRALIARALAQDAPVMLLDEPVASLDLRYQDEIYIMLRRLARIGRLVVVADHHLELAAAHADRVLILHEGRMVANAPPREALTSDRIAQVFGVEVKVFEDPVTGTPRISRPKGDKA